MKVPFAQRTFTNSVKQDSVYELRHLKKALEPELIKKVQLSTKIYSESDFSTPRILIVINNKKATDTVLVGPFYKVKRGGKVYEIDNSLKEYLIGIMPLELAESWIYNKMQR